MLGYLRAAATLVVITPSDYRTIGFQGRKGFLRRKYLNHPVG